MQTVNTEPLFSMQPGNEANGEVARVPPFDQQASTKCSCIKKLYIAELMVYAAIQRFLSWPRFQFRPLYTTTTTYCRYYLSIAVLSMLLSTHRLQSRTSMYFSS